MKSILDITHWYSWTISPPSSFGMIMDFEDSIISTCFYYSILLMKGNVLTFIITVYVYNFNYSSKCDSSELFNKYNQPLIDGQLSHNNSQLVA